MNDKLIEGSYIVTFDGGDLASGVYCYVLKSGSFEQVKRMMLVK